MLVVGCEVEVFFGVAALFEAVVVLVAATFAAVAALVEEFALGAAGGTFVFFAVVVDGVGDVLAVDRE